jgi:hypothetical protein
MKRHNVEGSGYTLSYVIPCNFPGGNKQRYETPQDSWCTIQDENMESAECKSQVLTLWRRNFLLNFSTPCISNVNITGTKKGSIMK